VSGTRSKVEWWPENTTFYYSTHFPPRSRRRSSNLFRWFQCMHAERQAMILSDTHTADISFRNKCWETCVMSRLWRTLWKFSPFSQSLNLWNRLRKESQWSTQKIRTIHTCGDLSYSLPEIGQSLLCSQPQQQRRTRCSVVSMQVTWKPPNSCISLL